MFTYTERDGLLVRYPAPNKITVPIKPPSLLDPPSTTAKPVEPMPVCLYSPAQWSPYGLEMQDPPHPDPSKMPFLPPQANNEIHPDLIRLPSLTLRGTFLKAYSLLVQIVRKVGWDELLRGRSSVFVMEEEYRAARARGEGDGKKKDKKKSTKANKGKEVVRDNADSVTATSEEQASTAVAADGDGASAEEDKPQTADGEAKEGDEAKPDGGEGEGGDSAAETGRRSAEEQVTEPSAAKTAGSNGGASNKEDAAGKEEGDDEEDEEEEDGDEEEEQHAEADEAGSVGEAAVPFTNKRLCERWLDNLFMVLYEVRIPTGACEEGGIVGLGSDLTVRTPSTPGPPAIYRIQNRNAALQTTRSETSANRLPQNQRRMGNLRRPRSPLGTQGRSPGCLFAFFGTKVQFQGHVTAHGHVLGGRAHSGDVELRLSIGDGVGEDVWCSCGGFEDLSIGFGTTLSSLLTPPLLTNSFLKMPSPLCRALFRLVRKHGLAKVQNASLGLKNSKTVSKYMEFAELFTVDGSSL